MDKKFDGSVPAFFAALTKRRKISEEEIDEIQKMIDHFRKGGG